MILISHRGNIDGPNVERENSPSYIDEAIGLGYDVEIDVWSKDGILYLGHDTYQYKTTISWLEERLSNLWIHCKNIEALEICYWFKSMPNMNYFWHQEDTLTLTSKGFVWAYPGKQPIIDSIAVMPELFKDNTSTCLGICSDYISQYRK